MDIEYPCGKDVVEAVLPHRDPFCWVSRIVACEPGVEVTAELDVDPELALFAGHFPGHPVLPGVIIMEALAQAASFCILVERGAEVLSASSPASTARSSAARWSRARRSR